MHHLLLISLIRQCWGVSLTHVYRHREILCSKMHESRNLLHWTCGMFWFTFHNCGLQVSVMGNSAVAVKVGVAGLLLMFVWVQFNLHIFQWVATHEETPYFHGWMLDRASKRYAVIPWKGRGWSLTFFPCFSDGLLQPHPEDASENSPEARGHDQPRLGSGFVVDGCRW